MHNSMDFSLPAELDGAVRDEAATWAAENKIARIWQNDASVWTGNNEAKWLGWLDIVGHELGDLQKYRELQRDIQNAGFTEIVLMGMGGSSLCPEVLAITFGKKFFHILDSTVPAQVMSIESKIDISRTLFIVASKSGSTLEPNCFKQYFFDRVSTVSGAENAGKQFIAITDPGSKMESVAREDKFRHIFYGKPEIGGRFSALSPFGLAAAAAMSIDVEQFLLKADEMVGACRSPEPMENPGAVLGIILGVAHRFGRDKLTIFTSPDLHAVGAWFEQLIAESTGKNGVGIIPVNGEPALPPDQYCGDRVFVYLGLKNGEIDEELIDELSELEDAGEPVVKIEVESIDHLGQEFFRWEFATAVAGSVMKINPFDQPDVESAKIEARKLTEQYEQSGSLPAETPFFEDAGIQLYTSEEYAGELDSLVDEKTLNSYIEAHLWNLEDGDYFAILAYIEMNQTNEESLQRFRTRVLEQNGIATCLGFGPRFLHSTGQAYKGGANNGVFLQITADDENDLAVPGQKYTFGVVKSAQARGDFQVLLDRGRRALRLHIGGGRGVSEGLKRLGAVIA